MVNYLRISVTDRCNLNCFYCRPDQKSAFGPREDILNFEEIQKVVELLAAQGISKIRLTGGEPLLRRDIAKLISMISQVNGISEICMTTNAVLLADQAQELKDAGLDRVNISLNSLKPERFEQITGQDKFENVWRAIEQSLSVGLKPVKLDVVLFKGINDDEILDFARLTLERDISVRFIEFFVTNKTIAQFQDKAILNPDVQKIIENEFGHMIEQPGMPTSGPAQNFAIPGSQGSVGFISSETDSFCDECNRLRLSSTGKLYLCLFSSDHVDLKDSLRSGLDGPSITEKLEAFLQDKPHINRHAQHLHDFKMSNIGG